MTYNSSKSNHVLVNETLNNDYFRLKFSEQNLKAKLTLRKGAYQNFTKH